MSLLKLFPILGLALCTFVGCRSPFTNLSNETPSNYIMLVGKYKANYKNVKGQLVNMELVLLENQTFLLTKFYPDSNQTTTEEKGRVNFTSNAKYLALKSLQAVYLHYFKMDGRRLLKVNIKGRILKKDNERITLVKNN
jgi:hypothetical protein